MREGVTEHIVNFISLRWTCTRCDENDFNGEMSSCEICKPICDKNNPFMQSLDFKRKKKWSIYASDDPIEEFIEWLLTAFIGKYPIIIYSHNGGRFESVNYDKKNR